MTGTLRKVPGFENLRVPKEKKLELGNSEKFLCWDVRVGVLTRERKKKRIKKNFVSGPTSLNSSKIHPPKWRDAAESSAERLRVPWERA